MMLMKVFDFIEARISEDIAQDKMTHREIVVLRGIIAEHHCTHCGSECFTCPACSGPHGGDNTPAPCKTIRLIASLWLEHPDYDQEWSPEKESRYR